MSRKALPHTVFVLLLFIYLFIYFKIRQFCLMGARVCRQRQFQLLIEREESLPELPHTHSGEIRNETRMLTTLMFHAEYYSTSCSRLDTGAEVLGVL